METPDYIVPPWLTDAVHETFEFWARVQNNRIAPYNVIEASEGDDIHVKGKVFIRPFRTIHKVKSQGYTLFEKRKRLKAEFRGTPGPELGRLRRSGVEIESTEDVPLFTFTGDTKASVLDRMPEFALRAKVFAIECTFLGCDEVDEEQAERKGHVHIDQLARRADKFAAAGSVMLCHFSKRYSNKDIEAAIANLPASMRAKTTYMPVAK